MSKRLPPPCLEDEEDSRWQPVSGAALLGAVLAVVGILWLALRTEQGWVWILDNALLAIHEAGHPLIGMFSDRLMVYGGTIFQILFPLLVAWHFNRENHSLGVASGLIWLGDSLLNIARYMADARSQILPLVGGGEHDWTEIFQRWHVLALDTRIAGFTRWVGILILLGTLYWLWQRYLHSKTHDNNTPDMMQ
jgi:hypothetical protein